MLPETIDDHHLLADKFRQFLGGPSFPCVGAKSALARNQLTFVVGRDIRSAWDDLRIYPALFNFAKKYKRNRTPFQSFVAIFEGPRTLDEAAFEKHLWDRLQSLTDKDEWHGQRHDPRISSDPDNAHFSLSFGGEGFFVIGLHPKASRPARRFPYPALVFNLHDQFEEMRKTGLYEKLQTTITERDIRLAGSRNPMLQTFGQGSEARQYSGRVVGEDWRCPFHREAKKNDF